jgi:hypothetical protein
MLSALPKLVDRNFIFGFFLPTLLFCIVALVLFRDQQIAQDLLQDLATKEVTKAAYVLLLVWVMAIALLTLNYPLYRFLEGYTFPHCLAECLKTCKRKRRQVALNEIDSLFQRAVVAAAEGKQLSEGDSVRYGKLKYKTARNLPPSSADVMPTDFGNAIKAFESYSGEIYGADGVTVWFRLATVIPKDILEYIQESRTQIDFLINCCMLSCVVSALAFGRIAYAAYRHHSMIDMTIGSWLAFGIGGLVSASLFYRWAITRVPEWGDWVMTAYDCYLPALAKELGYELPPTEVKRREFWIKFSQQLTYRRDPAGKLAFRVEDWVKPAEKPEDKTVPPAVVVSIDVNDDKE